MADRIRLRHVRTWKLRDCRLASARLVIAIVIRPSLSQLLLQCAAAHSDINKTRPRYRILKIRRQLRNNLRRNITWRLPCRLRKTHRDVARIVALNFRRHRRKLYWHFYAIKLLNNFRNFCFQTIHICLYLIILWYNIRSSWPELGDQPALVSLP